MFDVKTASAAWREKGGRPLAHTTAIHNERWKIFSLCVISVFNFAIKAHIYWTISWMALKNANLSERKCRLLRWTLVTHVLVQTKIFGLISMLRGRRVRFKGNTGIHFRILFDDKKLLSHLVTYGLRAGMSSSTHSSPRWVSVDFLFGRFQTQLALWCRPATYSRLN